MSSKPHTRRSLLATTFAAAVLLAAPRSAQTEALVVTGDSFPSLGVITEIVEVAINDAGDWIVSVRTGSMAPNTVALIRNGVVVLKPGDMVPGFPTPFAFQSARSLDLDAGGSYSWTAAPPAPLIPGNGAFRDTVPYAFVGTPIAAPGITPGTNYTGIFDQLTEPNGALLVHSVMNDLAITGVVDNAILRIVPAAGGFTTTVVVKRGDLLPGQTSPVHEFSESLHGMASNASGQVIYQATMLSGPQAVYLDQVPLAVVGQQSPVFGQTWASFVRVPVALNDAGDYAFAGQLSGTGDMLLVWNGIALAQEGDGLPAIAPHAIEEFGFTPGIPSPLRLSASGRVLWYADWNDPDTTRDAGLFLDHDLIVQEGVTTLGGVPIDDLIASTLSPARPIFDMSSDGKVVALRARLADGRTGAFLVRPDGAAQTIQGCVPNLGTLIAPVPQIDAPYAVTIGNAQSIGATAFVFLSTDAIAGYPPCGVAVPGFGEVLIDLAPPNPFLIKKGIFPASLSGVTFAALGTIPDQPELAGTTFYAQGLWLDTPGLAPAELFRLTHAVALSFGL